MPHLVESISKSLWHSTWKRGMPVWQNWTGCCKNGLLECKFDFLGFLPCIFSHRWSLPGPFFFLTPVSDAACHEILPRSQYQCHAFRFAELWTKEISNLFNLCRCRYFAIAIVMTKMDWKLLWWPLQANVFNFPPRCHWNVHFFF